MAGLRGEFQDWLKNRLIDIGRKGSSIILVGMGRSGTTWCADIINYKKNYRILFEPFFPARVKEAEGFEYIQYLNPTCNDRRFIDNAKRILAGAPRNRWVDRDNIGILYRQRIIKDIRCNLMLGALRRIFPQIPIVMIIRHPLQVINSWQRLGWGLEASGERSDFEIITSQNQLLEAFPIIKKAMREVDPLSRFDKILFQWCVFHHVPLRQLNQGEMFALFYENLLIDPEAQIKALFQYLDKPVNMESILAGLQQHSSTNFQKRDFKKNRGHLLNEWKKTFSTEQIDKTIRLLTLFDLDHLYNNEGLPSADHESCFLSGK